MTKLEKYLMESFHSEQGHADILAEVTNGRWTEDEMMEKLRKNEYSIVIPTEDEMISFYKDTVGLNYALTYITDLGTCFDEYAKKEKIEFIDDAYKFIADDFSEFECADLMSYLYYFMLRKVWLLAEVLETCPLEFLNDSQVFKSAIVETKIACRKNMWVLRYEDVLIHVLDDDKKIEDQEPWVGKLSEFIKGGNIGEENREEVLAMSVEEQLKCLRCFNYTVSVMGTNLDDKKIK